MSDSLPTPAIVVVAYNRPDSLIRLLTSISQAKYPPNSTQINLVISIDGGGENSAQVRESSHNFVWQYGKKEVIEHVENLGLIKHLFGCGDLSQRFGEIILLEDDLFVGKAFYAYAQQALAFYKSDPDVAGISLSALWFHGFTQLPFTPYPDAGDSFFMQIAWYQGQAYTAEQWRNFRNWLAEDGEVVQPADNMHSMYGQFPATDWFPLKTRYLVKTGRFYVFPRQSLAINFGEAGTHFANQTSFFQVPLQEMQNWWHFEPLADSVPVYDSWQEILPDRIKRLVPDLKNFDFETDFYGERSADQTKAAYLLTIQPSSQIEQSWGLAMHPPIANLIHGIKGDQIALTRPQHVDQSWFGRLKNKWKQAQYFDHIRPKSRRAQLKLWVGRWLAGQK